jgi:rhamnose utilization protein RhaD (predicted bifunctional aldolase and dehydrogenase)
MTQSEKAKTSYRASTKYVELPKKVVRTESNVDGKVAEKLQKVHRHPNWALEVKIKGREKSRSSAHQKKALKEVEQGKFLYKIPDRGARNPFDYVRLGDADAIVCVVDGRNVECVVNGGVIVHRFRV